ncbi:MAG: YciI family protein [Armatimonadota bacterium]|nr:YciI family protein [Armatimonadota bacterium]MDR7456632.1 YciI family protein [Armatimonadota bacterium]MDR7495558.1 YciI family protein [Armatimonadota bacterium]
MEIRIVIQTTEPLAGTAAAGRRPPLRFEGWLELLRALSSLIDVGGVPEPDNGPSGQGFRVGVWGTEGEIKTNVPVQEEERPMRFMMLVKASKESEAGMMPTEQQLADMAEYNEELVRAGVLRAGDGLQPTSKGARVRYAGTKRTVIDGPFPEAEHLVAGYWLIQVSSRDEAIEWARRVPFEDGQVEVRQVFELEDFGESEAVQRHARLRERIEKASSQQ